MKLKGTRQTRFWMPVLIFVSIWTTQAFGAEPTDVVADESRKEKLQPSAGQVFMVIGDVVVREKAIDTSHIDLPGSVDVLGWEQIKLQNLDNALELLRTFSGVTIGDYGNGGVPNGFTLRGHDSNSHGSHTVVTIDGIPINSHFGSADGAPDLNQLTPEEVDRVELIKGPIDAKYGNWSRAGVLHFHTRTRGDFQKAKMSYGSWDFQKAYVSIGSEHIDRRFNQVYSVEYYKTDGWRDNSERERMNAYGKWYYRPSDTIQIGLHLHAYDADWKTAGYIPEDLWLENPRQSIPISIDDGGFKELKEGSLHFDWMLTHNLSLQAKTWTIHDEQARFADWGSGQTESFWRNETYGLLSELTWDLGSGSSHALLFDVGFDYRHFKSHGENWNTTARRRDTLNLESPNNRDFEFSNYGTYLKARYEPISQLRLFAGVRQDWFDGDSTDWITGVEHTMRSYDVTTYTGGFILTPVQPLSLYANAASTFALPSGANKYSENAADLRDFFFWEAGFKVNPWDWLLFRYAYFEQGEDGLIFIDGAWVRSGDATRKGHELELNIRPIDSLELFSSLTFTDAKFDTGPNAGRNLPHIPDRIWKVGALYTMPWHTTRISAWYSNVGKWYTTADNQNRYSGYNVLDAKLIQSLGRLWTLSFDVKNLTDERYSEFVSFWSGTNQYAGSNARAFYLTLTYGF
jgi:iron complex outermembrane recepter protein